MDRFVIELDQEEKEELFELASFHFTRQKDLLEAIDLDRTVLTEHLEGDLEAIGIDTFDRLLGIVNRSAPRFPLDNSETYVEDTLKHQGEKRVKLDDEFQRFLFEPYTIAELEDITGKSEQTLIKYRNNTAKTVPRESYEELLEDTIEHYKTVINPSGDIHFRGPHNNSFCGEEDSFLVDGGPFEVQTIKQVREYLREIEDESPYHFGILKSKYEHFESAIERLEEGKSYIKARDKSEGKFFRALSELGLTERWGGKESPWMMITEPYVYEVVKKEVEEFIDEEENSFITYTVEELRQTVQEASKESGDSLTREGFDEWVDEQDEDYPKSRTVNDKLGWRNALQEIGQKPSIREYDRDIIIDQLLEKTQELGYVPTMTEIDEDSEMFSRSTMKSHDFDSYDDLLEEAGLYTRKKVEEKVEPYEEIVEESIEDDPYFVSQRDSSPQKATVSSE